MPTESSRKSMAAAHGCAFFAILLAVNVGLPSLRWPWYLAVPLFAYGGLVLIVGPMRRTAPTLTLGLAGGIRLAGAVVLALTSSGTLLAFQALFQPDLTELPRLLPLEWFGNLLAAGVCFSIVNALLEEIIFRGVVWEVVAEEWNSGIALVATSALFGLGHLNGYPPGPFGAVMAGLYGLCLGGLRWWTGGIGLATACHVCADATIFRILAASGALDGPK